MRENSYHRTQEATVIPQKRRKVVIFDCCDDVWWLVSSLLLSYMRARSESGVSDTRAYVHTEINRYTHLPSPQRRLGTLAGAPVVGCWLLLRDRSVCV